ncbi:MAG: Ger(x)C family spore germination protein [Clostridia bacterium]|nr:Ger(x)C family spore germination protein [Clostridia bacterium]
MLYKRVAILAIIMLMLINTACWDKIEIDDRGFIISMAIDIPEEERETGDVGRLRRYSITFGMPIVEKLVEKGGGGEKSFTLVTAEGNTIFDARNNLATRIDRRLFFDHAKIVIFGSEVFKDKSKFKELVDDLQRDYEINRKMFVGVVDGKAKDALMVDNQLNKLVMVYLSGIMENSQFNANVRSLYLDELIESLREGGRVLIPKIKPNKTEVKIAGAAIIDDFELKGWLGQEQNKYSLILEKGAKGGDVDFRYRDIIIPYQIYSARKAIKYNGIKEGKLDFTIRIRSEGRLREYVFGQHLMDKNKIDQLTSLVNKEIEKNCNHVIDMYQNKYKIDMLGIDDYMHKYYPKVWKVVEKNWDDYFCNANINVRSDSSIRRVGVVK